MRVPTRSGRIIGLTVAAVALSFSAVAYAAFYNGTSGADTIVVERNSSVAYLKGGNDNFEGARGDDGGSDYVRGGPGDDTVRTYTKVDVLRGGSGNDYLDAGSHHNNLFGGRGDDTLIAGSNVDQFQPGLGTDTCFGQIKDVNFPGECEIVRIVE